MASVFLIAAVLALGSTQHPPIRQSVADTIAIEQAAASYAATQLLPTVMDTTSKGRIAFDPRPAENQLRSKERTEALAKVLGAEVAPRTAVISCAKGCHMSEYAALVRIRLRSLTDTTAEVEMTVEWPSHRTRVPISLHQPWVLFEKRDGRWQFARTLRVRDT